MGCANARSSGSFIVLYLTIKNQLKKGALGCVVDFIFWINLRFQVEITKKNPMCVKPDSDVPSAWLRLLA